MDFCGDKQIFKVYGKKKKKEREALDLNVLKF